MLSNNFRNIPPSKPFPITRKAAIGFILLAIIVFSSASFDGRTITPPVYYTGDNASENSPHIITNKMIMKENPSTQGPTYKYRPPLLDFGQYNPHVITLIVEAFALACYLVAKKVEPVINAWEQSEREYARSRREESEENP